MGGCGSGMSSCNDGCGIRCVRRGRGCAGCLRLAFSPCGWRGLSSVLPREWVPHAGLDAGGVDVGGGRPDAFGLACLSQLV